MTEYTYMWAYIEEHPQETKRLLGLDHQQLLELIAYGKLSRKVQLNVRWNDCIIKKQCQPL